MLGGVDLALMAGLDEPGQISVDARPPEAVCQGATRQVEALMAKFVMHLQNKSAMFPRMDDDKLVDLRGTPTPKLAIAHEKL